MKVKRFLSALLCAALVFTLLPMTALAASEPDNFIFDVSEGNIVIAAGTGAGTLKVTYGATATDTADFPNTQNITVTGTTTAYGIVVSSGVTASITLSGVSIDKSAGGCAFYINDDNIVNLTLVGQNTLTSGADNAGLRVVAGASLTVDGTGVLTATGGIYGAGIGGGNTNKAGSVTVTVGTVIANGGTGGAGIGGGGAVIGGSSGGGGTVIISGGTVMAYGGTGGAGIGGGGNASSNGGNGGDVTITGGAVISAGKNGGAGIGGGSSFGINTYAGDGGKINISGGTVNTTGSDGGAGIGGGIHGDGGDVAISGGRVTAASNGGTSYGGAGIGGGGGGETNAGDGGDVTISGGTVTASGAAGGAGIGGGDYSDGGTVYISGGSVRAVASTGNSETIGHGSSSSNSGTLQNNSIDLADVYLTTVTLSGAADKTPVTSLTSATGYGINDVQTTGSALYLYLPADTQTTEARTAGAVYTGNVDTGAAGGSGTLYDVSLSGLTISQGTLSPAFADGTYAYTASVGNSINTLTVTPTANHTAAAVTVNGASVTSGSASGSIDLSVGSNSISVVVTAQDNTTTQTYTLTVTRAANTDASLSGLGISAGTLSPAFASGATAYAVSVGNSVNTLTVTPTANHTAAAVTVNGASVASGSASAPISLSVGENTVTIAVTAQDGVTTVIYTLTVTRASGTGGGTSTLSYSADVSGGGSLNVTVDKASGSAYVTVGDTLGAGVQNGGRETVTMPSIPGVTSYSLSIPVAYLTTASGGTLTFNTDTGSVTLPADMLSGVVGAEGKKAEITIGQGDKSALSEEAKAAIGDRPLIELSLTLDGVQTDWSNPDAPVTVSIPYTPASGEDLNAVVIWYIDGDGNLSCVPNGRYDPETGTVTFEVIHFSLYAVGYGAAQPSIQAI